MKNKKIQKKIQSIYFGNTLFFIPLIIMGGKLVVRIILNTWNMIES